MVKKTERDFKMKVLDSDFIIFLLRGNSEAKSKMDELSRSSDIIATTIFNMQEVLFGAKLMGSKSNFNSTLDFFSQLVVLEYDSNAVQIFLGVKHELRKSGKPVGIFDELIASVCLSHNASIITRNLKHFNLIPGLNVDSW